MAYLFNKTIELENGKSITFEIPPNDKVSVMVSGGADSAILLYTLAKIIIDENLNTIIYPTTGELLRRPFNIRYADAVVAKVKELTGFNCNTHLTFPVPNHRIDMSEKDKTETMSYYTSELATHFCFSFAYDGITANPSKNANNVLEHPERPLDRDDEEKRKEKENYNGLFVPFNRVDKRDIALLYKKMGVLDSLFPITRSCECEAEEAGIFFTKTCFDTREPGKECFWCAERQYGFGDLVPDMGSQKRTSATI